MGRNIKGRDTIDITHKDILEKYWDYDKNNELGIYPENYTYGSDERVWWKCDNGHKYLRKINYGLKSMYCPQCDNFNGKKISYPQRLMYLILKSNFNDVEIEKKQGIYCIDIYIKDINLSIEYDGSNWHNDEKTIFRDMKKEKYISDNLKCDIVRVREEGCYPIDSLGDVIYYNYNDGLSNQFTQLFNICENIVLKYKDTFIKNDYILYEARDIQNNNLINKNLLDEEKDRELYLIFDKIKNNIAFNNISKQVNMDIYLKCNKCKYQWKESVKKLTSRKVCNYCPKCVRLRRIIKIENNKKDYNGVLNLEYIKKDKSKEELYSLLSKEPNFIEVAKLFGISDNALRKRCKKLGIPHQSSYYNKKFEKENGYSYMSYKNYIEFKEICEDFDKILELIESDTKNKIIATDKIMSETVYNLIVKIHKLEPPLSLNQYDVVYKDDPRYKELLEFYTEVGKSRGKV